MERMPLVSKSVKGVGYDPETGELELEFATGRVYRYSDVPTSVYEWLLRTKNKGSFVTRMISSAYPYREIDTERPGRGTPAEDLLEALRASLSLGR